MMYPYSPVGDGACLKFLKSRLMNGEGEVLFSSLYIKIVVNKILKKITA
tara:strand:+ start:730 stop:876 length:147 start_codon:yes stop_codon:yes gene_type:complete